MRRILPALTAALLGSLQAASAQTTPPELVVVITVDQLRADYLEKYRHQFTGAFKRLLDDGAVFTNAHQDHAVTETAVGHAALLSGRFPRSVGVLSNRRGVADPQATMTVGGGEGASPFRFRGTTLFDWLRLQDPLSRALSVSVKDRGAILPLGRAKQHVFWWREGRFNTSTYYTNTLPRWVRVFNDRRLPDRYKGRAWTLLLPASAYPEPDTVAYENSEGKDVAFPHRRLELTVTPWMDEVLAAFALAGVDALKLGRNGHTDLLAVSFSATDYIGHRFGPDSREIHDQILRLDRTMGAFLDSLFARVAAEKIALVLTGDHGVAPFPQAQTRTTAETQERIVDAPRLLRSVAGVAGEAALANEAVTLESGMLMLEPRELGYDHALLDSIAHTFVRAARTTKGVLRANLTRELVTQDTMGDRFARRWHQMIPPDRAIPVVVTLESGYVWNNANSAHHGSPHDVDSHVPIIFYGPHFKPGSYGEFVRTVDIAPTLAHLLRIQPLEPLDGKTLIEILQ